MQKDIHDLKRELDDVKFETDLIKYDVEKIKDKLIDHTPEHFSKVDFIRSAIGALFLGFSVLFSGNLISIALKMPEPHFYIIILGTMLALTAEIYIIGYSRVLDKHNRRFGQFWAKRVVAFYLVSVVISFTLTYIFGIQYIVENPYHYVRVSLLLSAPCAIGASLADLLKKY